MPPYTLPEQKTLSGIQSREFQAGRRNQLILDDTQNAIQAQLSSDHDLSQLNLGYITRINHISGRAEFRGEGFELRTDGWGTIRTKKGLLLSTDKREDGTSHHKDSREIVGQLQGAESQHSSQVQLAVNHKAHDAGDQRDISEVFKIQNSEIAGSGEAHGEFTAPHIAVSSPSGIAAATPGPVHVFSEKNMGLTAGGIFSIAGAKSILASAKERLNLFAFEMGVKLIAAKGKVDIQAQSGDLDIIADKVMRLISAKETITLASPKEIMLLAGGSYIKLGKDGIKMGTKKDFAAHAAGHSFVGPDSLTSDDCPLPSGMINDEQFRVVDSEGRPFPGVPYKIFEGDTVVAEGLTDLDGRTPRVFSIEEKALKVIFGTIE
jgi:type VI secretion system secreted protein VgrG